MEFVYTADIMSNLDGGLRNNTDMLGNVDLIANIDGKKMFNIEGLTGKIYILNNHGSQFDADNVGSIQSINNIEVSKRTTKVFEAWLNQEFADGKFEVLAGLYDLNSEFYVTNSSSLFINSTFGIGTDMSQSGKNGPSIFPTTSLALRTRWQPNDKTYVIAAVLDGVSGDLGEPNGTQISLGNGEGELYAIEGGYSFNFAKVAIGGWFYSSKTNDLVTAGMKHNNNGIYAMLEKEISKKTTFFARFGFANEDVNQIDYAWSTGVLFRDILKNRVDNQLGVAISRAHNSSPYKAANISVDNAETGLEIAYSEQLTPWLRIQPDLQYTINPGTTGPATAINDSLVAGIRFEMDF